LLPALLACTPFVPELDYPDAGDGFVVEDEAELEDTAFEAIDEHASAADGPVRTIVEPVLLPAASAPIAGSPTTRMPHGRHAKAVAVQRLSLETISEAVRAQVHETRRCYNRALDRDRTIAGRVVISFVISPTGKVVSAIVQELDTDRELGICIAWVMKSLSFPAMPGSGWIIVNYPFNFRVRPHERPYGKFEPD
jgi:hypothetical protein